MTRKDGTQFTPREELLKLKATGKTPEQCIPELLRMLADCHEAMTTTVEGPPIEEFGQMQWLRQEVIRQLLGSKQIT